MTKCTNRQFTTITCVNSNEFNHIVNCHHSSVGGWKSNIDLVFDCFITKGDIVSSSVDEVDYSSALLFSCRSLALRILRMEFLFEVIFHSINP